MCRDCEQIICDDFCPNYEGIDPERGRPSGFCPLCGEAIYSGDSCYDIDDQLYCTECVDELDLNGVAELFGAWGAEWVIETLGGVSLQA